MFHIRLATVDDAEEIRDIYAPYIQSTAISFEIDVPSATHFREAITTRLKMYPWMVGETDGNVVGYAYASQHQARAAYRWSVDVSVYIASSHHRQGLGRLLYGQLFPILKRQGFRMVHAGITLPNEASTRLHESLGFQKVAHYPSVGHKCGQWRDVGWWSLDLLPDVGADATPSEPIPFPKLSGF